MKKMSLSTIAVAALMTGALSLGGCATRGFVREQVGAEDTKVGAVDSKEQATAAQVAAQQGMLQGHETRLGQLDKNTQAALDRAEAAGKLAEG